MQTAVKDRLQRMDEYDFEYFVADLWERMGWECEVSQASGDAGIDVVATKSNPYPQKKLIQAKRYGSNTTVGGPDIQQYASLKQQQSGVDSVIVVTTNTFTRAAEQRAEELNVKLVDGNALVSMVDDLSARNLLEKYDFGAVAESPTRTSTRNAPVQANETTDTESRNKLVARIRDDRDWYHILRQSIALSAISFFSGGLLLNIHFGLFQAIGSLLNVVWLLSIVAIAVSLYLDIRHVRSHSSWKPTAWQYIVGLLVFFVTLPVYFYRRRKAVSE